MGWGSEVIISASDKQLLSIYNYLLYLSVPNYYLKHTYLPIRNITIMANKNYFKLFIIGNILILITIVWYYGSSTSYVRSFMYIDKSRAPSLLKTENVITDYNVWLTLTRVNDNEQLKLKFNNLVENLLNVSSVPLKFHVIIDDDSKTVVDSQFSKLSSALKSNVDDVIYYHVKNIGLLIEDITTVMAYFKGAVDNYYSDPLFFASLGLYRFAPTTQDYAVMLDCDLYFKDDIALVFDEFNRFKSTALFGLAPELSPAYRDVLREYRKNHKTTFGDYYNFDYLPDFPHPRGYQGYNSGVLLLNLRKIREFSNYPLLLTRSFVEPLVEKYMFRNNLGDQDFYSILGYEQPDLIQTLNCGFNRQLCKYWNRPGYADVFENYAKCNHRTVVLHGNCNSELPIE